MIKNITIGALVAVAALIFFFAPDSRVGAPIMNIPALLVNATSTVVATAAAQATIPSGAQMWVVSNIGNADAYLSATTTNLVAGSGLWLDASSSLTFAGDTLWTGIVYGVTASGSTTTLSFLRF